MKPHTRRAAITASAAEPSHSCSSWPESLFSSPVSQAVSTQVTSVQCAMRTNRSQTFTGGLALVVLRAARHGRERARMEVGLDALAFLVHGVHLVAAAVFLDTADLPAFVLEQRGELLLRLPAIAWAGVAGGEAG